MKLPQPSGSFRTQKFPLKNFVIKIIFFQQAFFISLI